MARKGYAIVLLDVSDPAGYREYAVAATEIESRYGGVPLVAADAVEVVDGSWPTERVVVIEFPSLEAARAWYDDSDYRELITKRHAATVSNVLLVEGFLPR
jgi:uncharacterized protein (DUF1330 family)